MKKYFQKPGSLFLLLYLFIFSILFVLVLCYSREETHMAINSYHTSFLDLLMKYWTHLGDGILLIVLLVAMSFISMRHFFTSLAAYAIGGVGAQLFKRLVFSDFPRPVKFFNLNEIDHALYLVPGVDMYTWHSFPSGHTTTAFSIFFALALLSKLKISELLLFIMALGVGYSRVYLSQHFLMDIVAGAFLGMLGGWLAWKWISRYSRLWLDLPIQGILFKKAS